MSAAPRAAVPGASVLAALAVAFFWAVEGTDVNAPQLERVAILVTTIVLAWAVLRGSTVAAGLTAYLAILVAISERVRREPLLDGSDVLRATVESLGFVVAGHDPYAECLSSTVPPCSPFVYPPGELAWYAVPQWLFGDITRVDTWAGVFIVVALVLAGIRIGFDNIALPAMLYAAWGIAGYRAIDGSNDVSASALVVFACVALVFATGEGPWPRRAFYASAVLFGWAIAFKQFSLLVLPPVARYLALTGARWRRYTVVALGVAAAFVLPFLLWDPFAFINDQFATLSFHDEIWGTNLLHTIAQFGDPAGLVPLFTAVEIFGTLALVWLIATRWNAPSLGAAILVGAGLVLIPLLFAKWTTQPYYAYIGGIVAVGLAFVGVTAGVRDKVRRR
ncbi:MAG TPA: hypothetical protein VEU77_00715 [Candidatus Acidoferrales bacterium]|nr:hypothetical protein [Candidatus Acidoferrales bacterium]